MKKISEMTLEEVQDYALQLEEEKKASIAREAESLVKMTELQELNKALQKRNNDLFMRVEQGIAETPAPAQEEKPTESCEDFARRLVIGG